MHTAGLGNAAQHPESNEWLRRLARVGYAMKGVVYALIGVLAVQVALGRGGKLSGQDEAVRHVQSLPFGGMGLVVIGVGLSGYTLWRLIEAIFDVRRVGSGAKGAALRVGYAASGLINGAVAVTAFQLASSGHSGGESKTWIARLMTHPAGLVVLGLLGASLAIGGLYLIYEGYAGKFLQELRLSEVRPQLRQWLERFGRVGYIARGIVFVVCGAALVRAVANTDPSEARNFGEALRDIADQPFGVLLLGIVASGLFAYGAFLVATARYRKLGPT